MGLADYRAQISDWWMPNRLGDTTDVGEGLCALPKDVAKIAADIFWRKSMIHNITNGIENLNGSYSREREPILTIDSGDEIHAQTRCCWWGIDTPASLDEMPVRIAQDSRKDPVNDIGLCLVGPVDIRGAEPGMVLEVEVQELLVGAYGRTICGGPFHKERYDRLSLNDNYDFMSWEFDTEKGIAHTPSGFTVKLNPFLGCMGLAVDAPGHHSNRAAYKGGGNIDCKELVVGSILYLPIAVPGAQFSFGDGHAAQGDGESGDSAIECPMEMVKLKLTVRDDMQIQWPIADTPSGWITFGFHENLHEAMYIALNGMIDFIEAKLGITRKEAAMLSSLVVDLRITQIVNPTVGVHAVWAHDSVKMTAGS